MPSRSAGPAEERILLARQGWEGISRFLHDLREGGLDLGKCEKAIGGFAFADAQRDPFVEVLQRNMEVGDREIVVRKDEHGVYQVTLPERKRPVPAPEAKTG